MGKLFGTDGIRAVAGEYPLDPSTVFKIGRAIVELGKRNVVIGRDTRASGVWIERVLERAVGSAGGQVTNVGVVTTPGVSFLCRSSGFDAGVVISASHNPYQDNGIKVFANTGMKLSDEEESAIERSVLSDPSSYAMDASTWDDWREELAHCDEAFIHRYVEFLCAIPGRRLDGLRVVLDCANGASFRIAPETFRRLGAEVIALNTDPDGHNINEKCGALHPALMAARARDEKASLGIAFDGDSDRAILSDEDGRVVDGDHILLILARYLRKRGELPTGCVVTTVMANLGLEVALRKSGLGMVRTPVGDRWVLDEMLRGNHDLGGEQSGHVIIRQHAVAGDGILTALKIAQVLCEENLPLSRLSEDLTKYPQVLLNLRVREKKDFTQVEPIQSEIRAVENKMKDRGRVLIRYSGTEPLVRIMLEGENQAEINEYAQVIAARFREELGA